MNNLIDYLLCTLLEDEDPSKMDGLILCLRNILSSDETELETHTHTHTQNEQNLKIVPLCSIFKYCFSVVFNSFED